jgi:hypothetical protein
MRTMVKPPPKAPGKLEETIEIAEWPRNRKGQAVRVALRPYNGFPSAICRASPQLSQKH